MDSKTYATGPKWFHGEGSKYSVLDGTGQLLALTLSPEEATVVARMMNERTELFEALQAKMKAEAERVRVDQRWRDELTGEVPEANKGPWEREYVTAALAMVDADDLCHKAIAKATQP